MILLLKHPSFVLLPIMGWSSTMFLMATVSDLPTVLVMKGGKIDNRHRPNHAVGFMNGKSGCSRTLSQPRCIRYLSLMRPKSKSYFCSFLNHDPIFKVMVSDDLRECPICRSSLIQPAWVLQGRQKRSLAKTKSRCCLWMGEVVASINLGAFNIYFRCGKSFFCSSLNRQNSDGLQQYFGWPQGVSCMRALDYIDRIGSVLEGKIDRW